MIATRYHYAAGPRAELEPIIQRRPWSKPRGLWYCCGESPTWPEYAVQHQDPARLAIVHELRVDLSRVAVLSTEDEIDEFVRRFGLTVPHGLALIAEQMGKSLESAADFVEVDPFVNEINWPAVAREFDGVEVNPWSNVLSFAMRRTWLYGWDCSSGCIWNPASVEIVKREEFDVEGLRAELREVFGELVDDDDLPSGLRPTAAAIVDVPLKPWITLADLPGVDLTPGTLEVRFEEGGES